MLEVDGYPVNPTISRRLYLGPGETAIITLVGIDDNETEVKNVLLKANAAGNYKGWVNKENKEKNDSPLAYAILKLVDDDSIDHETQMWSEFNDIMNQPYFREDLKTV